MYKKEIDNMIAVRCLLARSAIEANDASTAVVHCEWLMNNIDSFNNDDNENSDADDPAHNNRGSDSIECANICVLLAQRAAVEAAMRRRLVMFALQSASAEQLPALIELERALDSTCDNDDVVDRGDKIDAVSTQSNAVDERHVCSAASHAVVRALARHDIDAAWAVAAQIPANQAVALALQLESFATAAPTHHHDTDQPEQRAELALRLTALYASNLIDQTDGSPTSNIENSTSQCMLLICVL